MRTTIKSVKSRDLINSLEVIQGGATLGFIEQEQSKVERRPYKAYKLLSSSRGKLYIGSFADDFNAAADAIVAACV